MTPRIRAEDVAAARAHVERPDYPERVYAALLGKVIGVYAGRPFEGWSYERITERFGEIDRYVAEDLGKRVVVTDDDIAGTIAFLRAAIGRGYEVTSSDVAETWLDALVEGRSVLWWGGMGNSTEHTAYLRLRAGYRPPFSGSAELNGLVVSEQIGAQIFIDGWGLIAPGAPHLAAELARRAAVVSHDGEAVFGAQVIAAMEAAAFDTTDVEAIINAALETVPATSLIARLVADLRAWREREPDWRRARDLLDEHYGYHRYGGGCHMIPNHGLIILALLYCDGDFDRAMTIVNTAGWDTDCNSGNVGCLLGLLGGLAGIDAGYDWRGPVADRIYVPTADAGGGITDVAIESRRIVEIARAATGSEQRPTSGQRFEFEFPGSLQGFRLSGPGELRNESLQHRADANARGLRIIADGAVELTTPTFTPLEALSFTSYPLDASPTLYSGQVVRIRYAFDGEPAEGATVAPIVRYYDSRDEVQTVAGDRRALEAGVGELFWTVPQLDGQPICEVGIALEGAADRFVLDSLGWSGTPSVELVRAGGNGELWRRAWVNETDFQHPDTEEGIRLISNGERRLAITGTAEWTDYTVEARLTPHAAEAVGLAARVQGLRRYYLVRLDSRGEAQLIRRHGASERVIRRIPLRWRPGAEYVVRLEVVGGTVDAFVDGQYLGTFDDDRAGLDHGGVAISCESGRLGCSSVRVSPLPNRPTA